ncbi:MAG: DsbA family protein [Alphaproteobacteria bacterium]|nr:DsbA family protein [Alphaproteobacteria bacterium]
MNQRLITVLQPNRTTRRAATLVLASIVLSLCAGLSPLVLPPAAAQTIDQLAKPVSLPDMALGKDDAPVTIVEFASLTCPHCADFNKDVFQKIRQNFIDSGKVRYIFREFPLDIKAAAGALLARCISKGDAKKYFAVNDLLFYQQAEWVLKNTTETLTRIGKQAGLSAPDVDACLKDQAVLDKIAADQKYASEILKINSTPTFFINGERVVGELTFEKFSEKINSKLKN